MNTILRFRPQIDRRIRSLLIHAVFLASLTTYLVTKSQIQTSRRITSTVPEDGTVRPIMHTFFEKVSDGESDLLLAWKEEWTVAGFDARVLTLKDAEKHPRFPKMEKVVRPLFGEGYNAMCLYRWLAMATAGGGWMCDYDTFPTNFPMGEGTFLPNGGRFTSFESHTPSLLSGTAEEWTRVAELLVDAIPRIKDQDIKSDMHAFLELRKDGNHDVDFKEARLNLREGFPYLKPLSYTSGRVVDCKKMAGGRAIHLAHRYSRESYEEGMFPLLLVSSAEEAVSRRGQAARIFMADWRHQCGGSNVK